VVRTWTRFGPLWSYTPAHHKDEHVGRSRVIMLGPQAQAAITPFLRPGYLFCRQEADRERRDALHEARKTAAVMRKSTRKNRKRRPSKVPGDCYNGGLVPSRHSRRLRSSVPCTR